MSVVNGMAKKGLIKGASVIKNTNKVALGAGVLGVAGAMTLGRLEGGTGSKISGNDVRSMNEMSMRQRITGVNPAPPPTEIGVAPSILAGARTTGNADNIGATGDMVFGMHNNR